MAFFLGGKSRRSVHQPRIPMGIDGIPEAVSVLQPGSLYAIKVPHPEIRRLLIAKTARLALQNDADAMIVSPAPEIIFEQLEHLGRPADALRKTGKLRLFTPPDESMARTDFYDSDQFVSELENADLRRGSLLLLDGADWLISWDDKESALQQVRTFHHLMDELRIIGAFVFAAGREPSFNPGTLNHLAPWLSGIAELSADMGRLIWKVRLWESLGGTVSDRQFGVCLSSDGGSLVADGAEMVGHGAHLIKAPDENRIIVTADAVRGETSIPDDWVIVPGYSEMIAAAENAVAATIILHYAAARDLRQLAQLTHQLRRDNGRGIKIIIRERTTHLRYNQQLLLRRVGANEVVYHNQRLSRLLSAVDALHSDCFMDPIVDDFDAALASVMPHTVRGYIPALQFCAMVQETLGKSGSLSLQHVLVRLRIRPETAHLDALLACRPARGNDILTADESDVYIFLFACLESDIDPTLQRILNVPVTELFTRQARFHQRATMLEEIQSLAKRAEKQSFVDFSLHLPPEPDHPCRVSDDSQTSDHPAPRMPEIDAEAKPRTPTVTTRAEKRPNAAIRPTVIPRTVSRGSLTTRTAGR